MGKIKTYLELVTFSHTVFALPFALLSMLTAADGIPPIRTLFWIIIAMISARTSAMAFNRLVDAEIDAANPRTKDRHIPRGKVSKPEVILLILGFSAIFIFSAYSLNRLCFILSPFALLIILSYSYSKRFTSFNHIWLGLSLAIAPVGAWIGVTGELNSPAITLGIAVLFWVAGFDIIYSIQDYDFDKREGLHSIVVKLGVRKALKTSQFLHVLTLVVLLLFSLQTGRGIVFYVSLLIIASLLFYEHSLVQSDDPSTINTAFFTVNGMISVLLLLGGSIDIGLSLR